MKYKQKVPIIVALVVLLGGLWFIIWKSGEKHSIAPTEQPLKNQGNITPFPKSVVPTPPASYEAQQKGFNAAFLTPIFFYGKVIDQYGNPVPQANVKISANDKPLDGASSKYARETDVDGLFSIEGIVGEAILVEVSKPGYRVIPGKTDKVTSSGVFEYGLPSKNGPALPTSRDPAVFVLYKYGRLEPLKKVGEKNFRIARNGSPLTISLDPEHKVVLRCWNTDLSRSAGQQQYDWRLEIAVVNGGLAARGDELAFEAPETGYQSSDMISMPASLPMNEWRDFARRSYFIHFNDNVFARVDLEMRAGGDHFVIWESYLNPKVGSRNLEFDPAASNSH